LSQSIALPKYFSNKMRFGEPTRLQDGKSMVQGGLLFEKGLSVEGLTT
jgi:hypothetical protein